jgi:peptidoglycan hydrolase-like protein with peptidoglycan-binding domain
MQGRRPPFRNTATESRRAAQAAAARKRRLLPPILLASAAPDGDAPPVGTTGEATTPQPPPPSLEQSDTPLPLNLSEGRGSLTATGGGRPPTSPPAEGDTSGSAPEQPNSAIRRAQEKLRDQGLYHGPIDGILGPMTEAALQQFLQKRGQSFNIDIIPQVIREDAEGLAADAEERQRTGLEEPTSVQQTFRAVEPIPQQGAGPRFTLGDTGQIAVSPPTQLDAAGNDIGRIRQFLPLVRRAADDLAAVLNPNQFDVLSRNVADYRRAIDGDASEIAWGIVFGLGLRLANAANSAQRQIEDRLLPTLEDPAQEALQSLNVLHWSLIMATGEGRELEEQADRLQMTREQQTAFRADAITLAAELHRTAEMIEPPADKIVTEAAEVIGEGIRAERGTVFGIATFKHVTTVLVSAATAAAMGAAVGGELGAAFGTTIGTAVGTGTTWLALEALKTSAAFRAATAVLGEDFDRLREFEGAKLHQRLIQLAPFRQFVVKNEQSLRRIATNTRQMRWMLPYIDFIVPEIATQTNAPASRDPGSEDASKGRSDGQVEYRMNAATISAAGLDVLHRLLAGEKVDQPSSGLSPREWRELMALLQRP